MLAGMRGKPVIVVMGVAGTGKSTLGMCVAAELGLVFLEGDDFHPPLNLQKLRKGIPLTDEDREPWLDAIVERLRRRPAATTVLSCSALKRKYRNRLRQTARPILFVHLTAPEDVLRARLEGRHNHFLAPSLLPSQLQDLQPPEQDENSIELDATLPMEKLVAAVAAKLEQEEDQR